jgi:hypothetical protein
MSSACAHSWPTANSAWGRLDQARTALAAALALYRTMKMTFWPPRAEAALAQVESGEWKVLGANRGTMGGQ